MTPEQLEQFKKDGLAIQALAKYNGILTLEGAILKHIEKSRKFSVSFEELTGIFDEIKAEHKPKDV